MELKDSDKKDLLGMAADIIKSYAAGGGITLDIGPESMLNVLESVYNKLLELAEKA